MRTGQTGVAAMPATTMGNACCCLRLFLAVMAGRGLLGSCAGREEDRASKGQVGRRGKAADEGGNWGRGEVGDRDRGEYLFGRGARDSAFAGTRNDQERYGEISTGGKGKPGEGKGRGGTTWSSRVGLGFVVGSPVSESGLSEDGGRRGPLCSWYSSVAALVQACRPRRLEQTELQLLNIVEAAESKYYRTHYISNYKIFQQF